MTPFSASAEIHAVLAPLGLTRSHDRPFAHGAPVPEVNVLVAADFVQADALESV